MEKRTIGQFIAVLRKANGMTQQEVAERLNVSNKAVSRWERDECAPDITLIPALAEMFGVTCDELLKGERIPNSENETRKEAKVEKQMKSLIHREISKYKTMMWIAVAVAAKGPIVMFIFLNTIYWLVEACVGVMLLFEIVAFVIETIAVTRMRDLKADSEIFESVDAVSMKKYNKCLGEFSFGVYFLIVGILLWTFFTLTYMLPIYTGYAFVILSLVFLYVYGRKPYIAWITGNATIQCETTEPKQCMDSGKQRIMNCIQIGVVILFGGVYFFAPYFDDPKTDDLYVVTFAISICLLLLSILTIVYFLLKEKENKKAYLMLGLRNILLFPSGLFFSAVHGYGWVYENEVASMYDVWHWEYAIYAGAWALAVFILYSIIKKVTS